MPVSLDGRDVTAGRSRGAQCGGDRLGDRRGGPADQVWGLARGTERRLDEVKKAREAYDKART
ncbi:hypothetical protein GCM10020367_36970 [Streptomyces sannanensis]|uniref:Uncharacterized protein n=1 Tax=Streptomyces sannanensis TaxID=285536 RepID=A0ABP6SDY6_9ACTN